MRMCLLCGLVKIHSTYKILLVLVVLISEKIHIEYLTWIFLVVLLAPGMSKFNMYTLYGTGMGHRLYFQMMLVNYIR